MGDSTARKGDRWKAWAAVGTFMVGLAAMLGLVVDRIDIDRPGDSPPEEEQVVNGDHPERPYLGQPPGSTAKPKAFRIAAVVLGGDDSASARQLESALRQAAGVITRDQNCLELITRDSAALKSLFEEVDFSSLQDSHPRMLKILEADVLLAAEVVRSDVERRPVSAYGVKRVAFHYRMELAIQLLRRNSRVEPRLVSSTHSEHYPRSDAPEEAPNRSGLLLRAALDDARGFLEDSLAGLCGAASQDGGS